MLNVLFPEICAGCDQILSEGEKLICIACRHKIPLIDFQPDEKRIMDKFYGRFPVAYAIALFHFQKKGLTQKILHQMKYKNRYELSSFFGEWLAKNLSPFPQMREIDIVIPVPLHKKKLRKRGYNQVEGFGKELAKALEIPYRDNILIKISKSGSQVFKTRILRFEIEEVFTTQNLHEIKDKHILLVDDIITTGATLENCAIQLLKGENVTISIGAIAIT